MCSSLIASETSELLGAANTRVAVYSPTDRSLLLVRRGTRHVGRHRRRRRCAGLACTRSVESVRDRSGRDHHRASDADVGYIVGDRARSRAATSGARISVPLIFRSGECAGAIEFGWSGRQRLGDDEHAAVALVAELTARSYRTSGHRRAGAGRRRETQRSHPGAGLGGIGSRSHRGGSPAGATCRRARHALVITATDASSRGRPSDSTRGSRSSRPRSSMSFARSTNPPTAQRPGLRNRPNHPDGEPPAVPRRLPAPGEVLDHMGIVAGAHVPVHDPSGAPDRRAVDRVAIPGRLSAAPSAQCSPPLLSRSVRH